MIAGLHYEDIKASIRKKYKTLSAFERAHDLPDRSINNLFRGNTSRRVREAVERHLAGVIAPLADSELSQSSSPDGAAHRLNREAA